MSDENDRDDTDDDQPVRDETPNASDPRSLRRQRTKLEIQEENRATFWRAVLANPTGRAEIWRLLHLKCGTFVDRFAAGPTGFPDPNAAWFQAGQKSIGLGLYRELTIIDREGVFLMHDENDPDFMPKQRKAKR